MSAKGDKLETDLTDRKHYGVYNIYRNKRASNIGWQRGNANGTYICGNGIECPTRDHAIQQCKNERTVRNSKNEERVEEEAEKKSTVAQATPKRKKSTILILFDWQSKRHCTNHHFPTGVLSNVMFRLVGCLLVDSSSSIFLFFVSVYRWPNNIQHIFLIR